MTVPLFFGFLMLFPDGEGGAQSGADVGGAIVVTVVFEAIVAVVLTLAWATLSRSIAVGETWVAWHPRAARHWRVLDFADIVSDIDMVWPKRSGVRLSRVDGGGLRVRPAELASPSGTALGRLLASHPAIRPDHLVGSDANQTSPAVLPPEGVDLDVTEGPPP